MWRRRVLFPQPLSPMTTKISPRRTRKLMPRWTTTSPKAMVRSRTSTWAAATAVALETEDIEQHREDGVHHDHGHDPHDDRLRGGLSHRGRAPPAPDPVIAAGERHDCSEGNSLEEPDDHLPESQHVLRLPGILDRPEVEEPDPHQGPPQEAEEVGVRDEGGQHQGRREDAREDEELGGPEPHRPQRVDLLVDGHRAEDRSEGCPGAAAHH